MFDFRAKVSQLMAFSRLFGKAKREVPSPTDHLSETEREDTVIVSGTQATSQLYPAVRPAPAAPDTTQLPYQLPQRAAAEQLQQMSLAADSGAWQPLQGVAFALNSRLTGDKDLENVRHTLDSVSSK